MTRIDLGRDTSGRPLVLDDRTLAKLRHAEAALGHAFTITQGSFRGGDGAQASAGTHDGAGVIDLRTWDLPPSVSPQEAVLALRQAGLIAWYRTTAQGFEPHIHAIDHGSTGLAASAAQQVEAWRAGRNGLASNGPDDGPRIPIPTDPPEDDMANYADQLSEILKQSKRNGRLTFNRDQRILKALSGVAAALEAVSSTQGSAATRKQVAQVRADIAALAESLDEPEEGA